MTDDDFSAKRRTDFWDQPVVRSLPGVAYTRFVRSMRLILPAAAACLLGVLVIWPQVEESMKPVRQIMKQTTTLGRNELINPHFESEDKDQQPFTVTAARAVQNVNDPTEILLEQPQAEITMKNGTKIAAQAVKGAWRQEEENLVLDGDVRLSHNQGYELTMPRLLVNMKTQQAWSDQPLSGNGPAGSLEATGMQANNATGILVFTGPAKLVLRQAVKGL